MALNRSIARRSFGRIERLPSGRYRAALHRSGRPALPAADDLRRQGRRRRLAVRPTCRDPDGGLGARRRGPWRRGDASRRPSGPYADQWLEGRKTKGRELRPDDPPAVPRCCSTPTSSRPSATSDSTGSQPRTSTSGTTTSRRGGRPSGRRPTACCAPSSRAAASDAAEAAHPVQPRAHPRRRQHEARAQGPARDARRAGDDRRRAARPLPADGAARRLVRDALRRADRAAPRRHRPADQPGLQIRRGVVRVDGEFIVGPPKSDAGSPRRRDPTAPGAGGRRRTLPGTPAPARMHCCSRPRPTATPTWRRRRCTRSTTRPGRPPDGHDLRWHDLRHTGAVLAAQTGATLAELMGRLGHSTPGAAMRYQHAAADRDAEIAKRLSALVSDADVKVER